MKIYVASSWKNHIHPKLVAALTRAGHAVYDFKEPTPGNNGFNWSDIDPGWENWSPQVFKKELLHPKADTGFMQDIEALKNCDACVLVLPCGRSAHLEAGFSIGLGKPTIILLSDGIIELMYKLTPYICLNLEEVIECINTLCKES